MTGYANDRAWSDAYMDAVKAIVGPMLLADAPLVRDRSEATDLIVLGARDMAIGVRLRRPGYAGKYPGQFTIRSHRSSGAKTELTKIVDGWGNWLFYGHAGDGGSIAEWLVIDLDLLRAAFIRFPGLLHSPDGAAAGRKPNGDGTEFRWFQVDLLPAAVVLKRSDLASAPMAP